MDRSLRRLASLALGVRMIRVSAQHESTPMWPFKSKSKRATVTEIDIEQVEIDQQGRLCVTPASGDFEMVYREAMEVYWDREGRFLFSPTPREMTYPEWFRQIGLAVEYQYGVKLKATDRTRWVAVPEPLRAEMSARDRS